MILGLFRANTSRAGIIQLLIGAVLISFSAVFVKVAHIGPTASGFYRNFFGALTLIIIVLIRRESLWRGWAPAGFGLLAAAFFAADLFFWHRSIFYVGPGLATILGNFQVFFLAVVGVMVFRERPTWRFYAAVPLAIAGLIMLVGVDWSRLPGDYRLGVVFGIATAVMYACYLLTIRRSQRVEVRLGATANMFIITAVSCAFMGAVAAAEHADLHIPDKQTLTVMVAYGALCQALGWIIITSALRKVEASRAGLILLLQPTLTFVWDILFFARPTTAVEATGAAIALAAIYLGNTGRR